MTYEVHYRAQYADKTVEVSRFEDPRAALDHAQNLASAPYYLIRLHNLDVPDEWLTVAQFAHRIGVA